MRAPRSRARRPSASSSSSMTQPARSPTRKSRDRGGQRRVASGATLRARALATIGADELVEAECVEVGVRHLRQARQRDRALTLLVLAHEPVEQCGDLLALAEA